MILLVGRNQLSTALEIANKAVSNSTITPILNSFLFKINENELKVCASNLELFITKRVDIKSEAIVNVAIPATRLIGLVRDLPEQLLTFEIDGTDLIVKAESGNYKMPILPGEDFPEMDISGECIEVVLPSGELTEAFNKTTFAASKNVADKTYGFCIDIEEKGFTCTGCERVMLSTQTIPCLNDTPIRVVLPIKAAEIISTLEPDKDIKITAYPNNISFEIDGTEIKSILIENIYPDFRAITPLNNEIVIKLGRELFLSSTKRVVAFSNKEHTLVKITITENQMQITGEDVNFGEKATEGFPIEYTGEQIDVVVNGSALMVCLQHLFSTDVFLFIKDGKSIVVVRPDETNGEKTDLMLLMPFTG